MKIGIDARQISHSKRHGLRTYVENLVKALSVLDDRNQYILYIDSKQTVNLDCLGPNFTIKILPWSIKFISSFINDNIILPLYIRKDKIDLMHYPAYHYCLFNTVKTVITLHDVIPFMAFKSPLLNQGLQEFIYYCYMVLLIKRSSKIASNIITISKKSMDDLKKISGFRSKKISVIYEAVNNNFTPIKDEDQIIRIKKKYNLGKEFIFGFSHKNGNRIIEAYDILSNNLKAKYCVGLIWQENRFPREMQRLINKRKLDNRVICIPPVSEKDLVLLYNAASLFVFPSFYEGFGLPVLEAMQCGCPVISSRRGSLPEVAGNAAIFVDELDNISLCRKELAEKMETLLIDENLRNDLIIKGFIQAKKFSWEKTAKDTLNIYEKTFRLNE